MSKGKNEKQLFLIMPKSKFEELDLKDYLIEKFRLKEKLVHKYQAAFQEEAVVLKVLP